MVIDSADQAIYIAPKTGSKLADFIDQPLPQSFQVEVDQDTELMVQVVPAWLGSASEFGYVSFPFEVVIPAGINGSLGLCATYEEDKQRLDACYGSKACLIGKWWFKAFIDTSECVIEYVPDSVELGTRGMVKLDTNDIPWIEFGVDGKINGETTVNNIGGVYHIDDEKLFIPNITTTLIQESQWAWDYLGTLSNREDSLYHYVSFRDTLFLFNSKSKFLYVKEKPEL